MSTSRKPRRKRSSPEAVKDELKRAFEAIWNRPYAQDLDGLTTR
jgi:hypothetical protein